MKIEFIGTGSVLSNSFSACALLNRELMIDIPNGVIKRMRQRGIDIGNIDTCLITHLHGDHYFDIPFLLMEQGIRKIRGKPLTIIGPPKTKHTIEMLFDLANSELAEQVINNSKIQ